MIYKFDAVAYRRYGLIRIAFEAVTYLIFIYAVLFLIVWFKTGSFELQPSLESRYMSGSVLPLIISAFREVRRYQKDRDKAKRSEVFIEEENGMILNVRVLLRDDENFEELNIKTIDKLKWTRTDISLFGYVENEYMYDEDETENHTKVLKHINIPRYFQDMDGMMQSLERYQRQMQEREWEEAHETRI